MSTIESPKLVEETEVVSETRRSPRVTAGAKRWIPLLIAPICLGLLVVYFSAVQGLALGFTDWDLISPAEWIGLQNFETALNDPLFWKSLGNTLLLVVLTVPAKIVIGLGLGLALARIPRFGTFFRLALFFPTTCSVVAVAFIWMYLYDADGILNQFARMVGLPAVNWMAPERALSSIGLMIVWAGVGYVALLYVAGLKAIPNEYYDAARVDGANAWQRFRYLTLPMLTPTTFFVLITGVIAGFQTFGEVYVLSGPLNSTLTILRYIYDRAFTGLQMGYAAALSIFLIALLLIVTTIQLRVQKRWVNYEV
ncbi:sugar ABC transporter permease [Microbacterium sp. ISL-59]|uniref:carbohydrate ABC transporter permease n=1 Tax=Microbacterium sp. ISL-59 TaxID=2819159 RepID=UPI001BEADA80|nr:sugar ABC transporter permease [Microbacterium sp. ISL-59]MBT2496728.1 sugar ABC transporter permease [Microbacterium sp. ISL-59]